MALFRIRRPVRLLPGPRLSLNQAARAPVGTWAVQATFDRRAQRTTTVPPTPDKHFSNGNERSMNNPRKQQPPVVSLLVAAVLALWLVLSLMGHH